MFKGISLTPFTFKIGLNREEILVSSVVYRKSYHTYIYHFRPLPSFAMTNLELRLQSIDI
jgi:hypothetical protein